MGRKCKNIPIPRERNVGTHNAVRTAERGPTAGPFLWHGRERGTAVWTHSVVLSSYEFDCERGDAVAHGLVTVECDPDTGEISHREATFLVLSDGRVREEGRGEDVRSDLQAQDTFGGFIQGYEFDCERGDAVAHGLVTVECDPDTISHREATFLVLRRGESGRRDAVRMFEATCRLRGSVAIANAFLVANCDGLKRWVICYEKLAGIQPLAVLEQSDQDDHYNIVRHGDKKWAMVRCTFLPQNRATFSRVHECGLRTFKGYKE
ncbi:hypothetical protein OsI_38474 [Oryza sativa Indica Group]|uniref:Uncharacterized protein n=1 Tax=Oryza sativa subsp. indica TaxID=39946 RepID=B8BM35_ORYSI|nr:hypothetical protein OsI_38474 [Oryza sativa Indica Group]